jgi:hypothetical protein
VLSAHVRREDLAWLSAKEPLPAGRCRVASAERKTTSAERIGALGIGIESSSESEILRGIH